MRFHENEEAVSPVIGVILMVAITVILAAVIAVFVFGMTDSVQTTHTVAATAKVSGDNVIFTYQGGPDADKVTGLQATMYNTSGTLDSDNYVNLTSKPDVGYSNTFYNAIEDTYDDNRIVITATFDDGSTQVILDKLF